MFDIKHLLPSSASPSERTIETVMVERIAGIDAPIARLWNVDTCPVNLLPWMAWAFSVEVWDHRWPEAVKRNLIRGAVKVHRSKGTKASVIKALAVVGIEGSVSEWFEHDGAPHTFRVDALIDEVFAAGFTVSPRLVAEVERVIGHVKPVRAHYDLRLGERVRSTCFVRSGVRQSAKGTASITPTSPTFQIIATARAATGLRERSVDRAAFTPIERSAA